MITSQQLLTQFPKLLNGTIVNTLEFHRLSSPENFQTGDIIVCENKELLEGLSERNELPGLVITNQGLLEHIPEDIPALTSPNPRLVHAFIKQLLNEYRHADLEWDQVHSSAIIHPSSQIPNDCRIGPNVVIGANVNIGKNTVIRSNSVIEHNVVIGDNCTIHNQVNIGYGSQIGNRVIIRSGVIIGNEGFGFAKDENNQYHRVPHTGHVEIQDDVHISSNCNIDRGTYGATLIKLGCKLDALCHIAHNVELGENCILVAQCGIAGSTVVGDRVILSGQTGVLDHKKIADDAVLVHRAGVISDIPEGGVWGGLPPKPMKEHMKRANSHKILEKKIAKLEEKIAELKSKTS